MTLETASERDRGEESTNGFHGTCFNTIKLIFRVGLKCQYLVVGKDREADGTLFSQHSLNKLPVMGLTNSLHYIFQRVGSTVFQEQRQCQLTATPARKIIYG